MSELFKSNQMLVRLLAQESIIYKLCIHPHAQSKVQQLYQLDQLLHEESGTMQSLQRDKEDLERALGGLRKRLHEGHGPPQALDAARKQQHTLERELSRVHQLLADNSKVVKVPLNFLFCFCVIIIICMLALHGLIHSNHVGELLIIIAFLLENRFT